MKNNFRYVDGTVEIELNSVKHGKQYAIVSIEDFDRVNEMPNTWHVHWSPHGRTFYAVANYTLPDGNRTRIQMHRWIMAPKDGEVVDHINHNTLDNRRENLRNVTPSENGRNRKGGNRQNKVGVHGVSYREDIECYRARVHHKGKQVYSEHFDNLAEAISSLKIFRESAFKQMSLDECKAVIAETIRSEVAKGTRKANVEIELIHFIKRILAEEA